MKSRIKICLLVVVLVAVGGAVFNLEMLRDITARHFDTVSVINAKKRMQTVLEEKYPDKNFKFVSGSYKNASGNDDDTSYTGDFEVDGQSDNIISVVYSDNNFKNVWDGNIQITVQTKPYERKCTVATRLAGDYTDLVKKEMWDELNPYILNQTDIMVKSFYQDPDYEAPLPEWMEFGVKFDKTKDLDYEFRLMVQIYQEGEEENIAQDVISSLTDRNLMFEQYDFIFVSGNNQTYYIYDSSGELKEQYNEKI